MSNTAKRNSAHRRAPYRVGVVGPGGLGNCAIREISRLPEMQLVALLAFSADKNGRDAGELAGTRPLGVKATTNFDDFLRADCECVIYTARDYGDFRTDEQILRLLEAGRNVITPLPYHYLKGRGEEVRARFENAAKEGKATLFGTGITPGFFNERLAMLMTGLSNDIEMIKMQEFINGAHLTESVPTLQILGIGSTKAAVEANPAVAMMAENYLTQPIHFVADRLGFTVDKIERTSRIETTKERLVTPVMTIEAGTVGLVNYSWTGYSNGKPFYRTEVFWYLGDQMKPQRQVGTISGP